MMKRFLFGLAGAAAIAGAGSAASATDWWLVQRPPSVSSALFVDTDTLVRGPDGTVTVRVLRIDREGRSSEGVEAVSCASRPARNHDALGRFACASPQERDSYGLILAAMSPQEAARLFFSRGKADGDDLLG